MKMTLGTASAQCGNYGNLLSRGFDKKFVKATFLLNSLANMYVGIRE